LSFAFPWRCCGELANIISVLWIPTCPCSCLLHFPEDVVVSLPTSSLFCESPHVPVFFCLFPCQDFSLVVVV
jgi:hypothetical protein